MQRFLQQKTFEDDYLQELANERSETERLFILRILAKKEAENRRRPARGWIAAKSMAGNNGQSQS
jgi:hypothetical protein